MINRICEKCIHYDVCLLHEDNFIDDVAKNGFCGKFKNKADFAEVVRCKDCRYNKPTDYEGKSACIRQCAYKKPDDFCSYGERREGDATCSNSNACIDRCSN